MNKALRWLTAAVCAASLVQAAEAGFSLGGKLWYVGFADPVNSWRDTYVDGYGNAEMKMDSFALIGPKFEWTFPNSSLWVSGMFLYGSAEGDVDGSLHYSSGVQAGTMDGSFDFALTDAEVLVGYSLKAIDVGIGFRHTIWKVENFKYNETYVGGATYSEKFDDVEVTIFGPMIYAGTGQSFGNSPIGWYAGGSFMFLDLGSVKSGNQEEKDQEHEHYNIEGGLSFTSGGLLFTFGYRMKKFLKYDGNHDEKNDMTQSGLAASGVFTF